MSLPIKHKPPPKRGRRVDNTGHSMGDGKHMRLYEWMMHSVAWQSLSVYARCLYIEFGRLYNGYNNGQIFLSEREAGRRVQCNPKTASTALKDLEKWGFIKPVVQGSFYWKQRHATCWRLTEFPCGDALPTKDFMHFGIQPERKSRHPLKGQTAPVGGADGFHE